MIGQMLELDTFGMGQEEQIDGFVDGLQLHLFVIVGQEETEILGDDQTAELTPGCLNTQFLEQGHTDGAKQKVSPTLCLQLTHKPFQLLRQFVR